MGNLFLVKVPNFGGKNWSKPNSKSKLSKYCFLAGFKKKVYFEFSYPEMQE